MTGYFSFPINKNRFYFILCDFIVLLLSITAAHLLRWYTANLAVSPLLVERVLINFLLISPITAILFYLTGLYSRWGMANFSRTVIRLFFSLVLLALFNSLWYYVFKKALVVRFIFILQVSIFLLLSIAVKLFILLRLQHRGAQIPVILVNFTAEEKALYDNDAEMTNGYRFSSFEFREETELEDFFEQADDRTLIVFSAASGNVDCCIATFLRWKLKKYNIYDIKTFYINVTGKIPVSSFGEVWSMISENSFTMGIGSYYRIKRMTDFVISLVLSLLTAPFLLLVSMLVKLSSRGPVFFVQERLGLNKKPFKLIKFRTMVVDAETGNGPQWATEDDPRVTKLGKFLRKSRLDELPQLLNVLKGEMSIVGTRPIRKHFADLLARDIPYYDLRFFIKPGLTGWSQVKYDYAGSVQGQIEKFKYELFYLKHMNLILDTIILLKTLKTVFTFNGK